MKNTAALAALLFLLFTACKNEKTPANIGQARPDAILIKADSTTRVEPMNWWIGFKNPTVEVMIHRKGIGAYEAKIGKYEGVRLVKAAKTGNPNYLFLELMVYATAKPGNLPLIFEKEGEPQLVFDYPLLAREGGQKGAGVTSKDVVYLLMPDRFANGDPSNDNIAAMRQPKIYRDSLLGRHGGDLKGIADHLDYFQELGVNTLWLNPELENDQLRDSYHGYAITDFYKIDRRFGSNEQYRDLVNTLHSRKMKVVRDVVINHCGIYHWWMTDLPTPDWVHQFDTFTRTTYRAPTLLDPYASQLDKKLFDDGWFDRTMPDLNQRNPFLANYLIQNMIWWVEFAGIDGLRIDTYTYSDQTFMSRFCEALRREYPDLSMVGEIWEHGVAVQGHFADNQPVKAANFDSNLPGVIDFQLQFAIQEALTREQGWTEGACRLYYMLAQDRFYENPMRNLIFLDNHDMTRIFGVVGLNLDKWKSGMVWLMTERGVPQLYYGTELLFTGDAWKSHGLIRQEMPGAWPGDARSVFTAAGRTAAENEAFDFSKKIIGFRNATPVLQTGKLMQFVPENSVYTYFRYDENASVMVVLNTANSDKTIDMRRFAERLVGFKAAKNVLTGEEITDLTAAILMKKNSPLLLELKK